MDFSRALPPSAQLLRSPIGHLQISIGMSIESILHPVVCCSSSSSSSSSSS
jgi:hypothetical protein